MFISSANQPEKIMFVTGDQIKVGDVLETFFNGGSATVKSLRAYTGPLGELLGEGTQIAEFVGLKSGMTLPANQPHKVLDRAA